MLTEDGLIDSYLHWKEQYVSKIQAEKKIFEAAEERQRQADKTAAEALKADVESGRDDIIAESENDDDDDGGLPQMVVEVASDRKGPPESANISASPRLGGSPI